MANVTITQLPAAGPITGTESVPIVQNGQTVQTTTAAIAASPSQTQTFLTINQEPTLPNSRYMAFGTGLGYQDNGAQSYFRINLTGASLSLENALTGIIAKTGGTTVTPRTLTASGLGLTITDGSGVAGNPTFSLNGLPASLANLTGTAMLAMVSGSSINARVLTGTANEIAVTDGNGAGNPTFRIASNPVIPGSGAMTLPKGTTAERPSGIEGQIRFNTDLDSFEGYINSSWEQLPATGAVTSFSGGTTGLTPSVPTTGPITLSGILSPANGGTGNNNGTAKLVLAETLTTLGAFGITLTAVNTTNLTLPPNGTVVSDTEAQTLTNKTIDGASNTLTNIDNASLVNSSVTINGTTIDLGDTVTITAATPNALTFNSSGAGTASGSTWDGAVPYTISYNTIGASPLAGSTSFTTAGTITTGTWNATPIGNSYLANSSFTIGSTSISLGGSTSTLAGLTSVTLTQAPTAALQVATKQYVDDAVSSGIDIHTPVRVETPTALNATYTAGGTAVTVTDITGGTTLTFSSSPSLSVNDQIVFASSSNGIVAGTAYYVFSAPAGNQVTLSLSYGGPQITTFTDGTGLTIGGTVNAGVGATLTNAGTKAALQIDGVNLSVTNRVLVYNQVNAYENGVYTVTTVGTPDPGGTNWVLTRSTDTDRYRPDSTSGLGQGDYFFVQEGSTGAGESYVLTTANPLIIGTTNLTFTQFSASQVYSAGTGLTLSGTQFSLTAPVTAALGGTGYTSYSTGDILYASGATALSKLAIGSAGDVLTSTGTAPQYVAQSTLSVGTATNATNIAVTLDSTNATNYLAFVNGTSGNKAALVNSSITCNPSTGKITGGVAGGSF